MSPGRVEYEGEVIASTNQNNLEAMVEVGGGRVSLTQDILDTVHVLVFEGRSVDEFGLRELVVRRAVNVPKARVPIEIMTNQGIEQLFLVVD